MNALQELSNSELNGLACIAEGRGAAVAEHVVQHLLALGLTRKAVAGAPERERFELTPAGLALIRSSDQ